MYQKTILENGVRILSEEIPYVRSVAIGVWINSGSRYESDDNSGISHFIEHMMFKGTKRRSAKAIAEELDAVGGNLNAFTTKEYTCYYAKVLDEHLDLAIDLLSNMLFESLFSKEDLERERNVIIEEIKMCEDTPDELVHDIFTKAIWHDHPLGRPVIGSKETVALLSRNDLLDYYNKHYTADNIIVTIAGNIKHEEVVEKIESAFGKVRASKRKHLVYPPEVKRDFICRDKDTEQVHMVIGTPGYRLKHEDIYAVQIMNIILGGGVSSRLFQKIREQRGLVYSVYSYHSSYHDTGLFGIYTGLSKHNINKVIELILEELNDISQHGISECELKRAKDQFKGNLLLSLENINTRMSRLGRSEIYLGKVLSVDEIIQKIYKVTNDDIKRVAFNMFKPDHFSISAVGMWQDCDDFELMLNKLF
ncbi:insulinase family protein [Peptococcaceae bacterium]|nr:insulinase family protein [Peptococcaceae bacterium]